MPSNAPDPGVEPGQHPEVPTPDAGRETVMPNRHSGEPAQTPGPDQGRGPVSTPDAPVPEPDSGPDPITPPDPVGGPQPEDPSLST